MFITTVHYYTHNLTPVITRPVIQRRDVTMTSFYFLKSSPYFFLWWKCLFGSSWHQRLNGYFCDWKQRSPSELMTENDRWQFRYGTSFIRLPTPIATINNFCDVAPTTQPLPMGRRRISYLAIAAFYSNSCFISLKFLRQIISRIYTFNVSGTGDKTG